MRTLKWLSACITVYSRRLASTNRSTKRTLFTFIFGLLLAATIGLPATIILLLVCVLVLPALNVDVKAEIDREYAKRK